MIFSTTFNILILSTIIGFSYILKYFINSKNVNIYNRDVLYGLFFIFFLSLLINFVFPLKYFLLPFVVVGAISFLLCIYKKRLKINLFIHFLILFFMAFITYRHGDNIDSPMYHMQIIKWLSLEKVVFGLSNLELRFGINSLWFSFLSLFQFQLNEFNSIYILNFLPFSILFYEALETKKKNFSYIFLTLSISFLIFFSYLHPFANGIILNHLHNPETDTVAMVFFIFCFYLFLKFQEEKNIDNFRLIVLSAIICFYTKISYMAVLVFPILVIIMHYKMDLKKILINKLNLLILSSGVFWSLKSFINSGCLVFPVKLTCFNTSWSPDVNKIDKYSKIVKSFARDTRERLRYTDFEHTIYSFDWFVPWFKDYAVNTAMLKISALIIIISIFFIFFSYLLKLNQNIDIDKRKNYLLCLLALFLNLAVWFQAPEIRFGWGTIIVTACFFLSISLFYNKYFEHLSIKNIKFLTILIFGLILYDNQQNLKIEKIITPYGKNFVYSKITKFANYNGFDFYVSNNWMCYDFKQICVNSIEERYNPKRINGYLFFLR